MVAADAEEFRFILQPVPHAIALVSSELEKKYNPWSFRINVKHWIFSYCLTESEPTHYCFRWKTIKNAEIVPLLDQL